MLDKSKAVESECANFKLLLITIRMDFPSLEDISKVRRDSWRGGTSKAQQNKLKIKSFAHQLKDKSLFCLSLKKIARIHYIGEK